MQFIPDADIPTWLGKLLDLYRMDVKRVKFTCRWQMIAPHASAVSSVLSSTAPIPLVPTNSLEGPTSPLPISPTETFEPIYQRKRGSSIYNVSHPKAPESDPENYVYVDVEAFLCQETIVCIIKAKETPHVLDYLNLELVQSNFYLHQLTRLAWAIPQRVLHLTHLSTETLYRQSLEFTQNMKNYVNDIKV